MTPGCLPFWARRLRLGLALALSSSVPALAGPAAGSIALPPDLAAWDAPSFLVASLELAGAHTLPEVEKRRLKAAYEGRMLTLAEAQALRDEVAAFYAEAGYLQAQVTIPDQRLGAGRFRLQIDEGTLARIEVTSDGRLDPAYVQARLARRLTGPLRLETLQEALLGAQEDQQVARLDASLRPGGRPGEAVLAVAVEEAQPWALGLSVDNHRPESIGAESGRINLSHQNVTGKGDQLALSIAHSEGSDAGALHYRRPLNAADATLAVFWSRDEAQVLEAPFSALAIESQTDRYGLQLQAPLRERLRSRLSTSLAFERRVTVTKLLGERFSLSPGAVDGEAGVNAASLALDYVYRGEAQVLALRGTLRRGLRGRGTTRAAPGALVEADGTFLLALLQGQFQYRLAPHWTLTARGLAQFSRDPLLAAEKLSLGGASTVRGYRENLLVRDNGVGLNVELAYAPFQTGDRSRLYGLSLVAFLDGGAAWDEGNVTPNSTVKDTTRRAEILGGGLGLHWEMPQGLTLKAFWGQDLADNFAPGEDPREGSSNPGLQNQGVHLQLSYLRRF